jgi:hypothetical protein
MIGALELPAERAGTVEMEAGFVVVKGSQSSNQTPTSSGSVTEIVTSEFIIHLAVSGRRGIL